MMSKNRRKKIILDANFFFVPSEFQIDIFEEIKRLSITELYPVILSSTYSELKRLEEKGSSKIKREAKLALRLTEECCFVRVSQDSREKNDDVIVRIAKKWNCPVATNDRELRKKLRREHVPTIFLRERSHLEIEGFVN